MSEIKAQVAPVTLFDRLKISQRVPLSFVPQVIPVVDIERHLLTPTDLQVRETGDLLVNAIGFQGITVPEKERWTVHQVGAMTDTLDADQAIVLQTAIEFPSGQAYVTDVLGVALSPAAGRSRGGVGIYFPPGLQLMPGFRIGINVGEITVGVALTVSLFVGTIITIDSL
jgi:hypothetical protein